MILELANRCETEEPSRELDHCIWWALRPNVTGEEPPPSYTTSLDAAVTLVPDQWAWFVEWIGAPFTEGMARLWIPGQRTLNLATEQVHVEAKTPALAICAAALRARAAMVKP